MFRDGKKLKFCISLMGILILASFLRLYHITYHDSYTDEAVLAFRSIGMMDYTTALNQTTPWQWLPEVPWWAHLSFHDHPIFFFLIQHAAIRLFGENMLGVRLPAFLAGIVCIPLIYLLGKQLFNQRVGILAALLLSVQSYHVWVSRLGIQDGLVVMFLLLILWLWLQALEKEKWWLWILWGTAVGLGIITKFTVLIILPILVTYAAIYRHKVYKNKLFWLGIAAMFVCSSPSWLYNIFLFKTFGHFDYQISALLGQEVAEWTERYGRELAGGLYYRFLFFFKTMHESNSLLFIFLTLVSFVGCIYIVLKNKSKQIKFLIFLVLLTWLWFFVIGSTYRFMVMIIPWLALMISYIFFLLINTKWKRSRILATILLVVFFVFELFFTTNSFLTLSPWGTKNRTYAQVRAEVNNYGFNEVDGYLEKLLKGRVPAFFGKPRYNFLAQEQKERIEKAKAKGAEPLSIVVIYDANLSFMTQLWTFGRRVHYYGWPMMGDDLFLDLTKGEFDKHYREQGIDNFLYIKMIQDEINEQLEKLDENLTSGERMVDYLQGRGIEPEVIYSRLRKEAFWVYSF